MKFELVADKHHVYLQSTVPNELANLVTSAVIAPQGPDELIHLKNAIRVLQMRVDEIDPDVSIQWEWRDRAVFQDLASDHATIPLIKTLRQTINWEQDDEMRYLTIVHAKGIIRTIRNRSHPNITANELLQLCVECCNVNRHIVLAQYADHTPALEQFARDFMNQKG